MWESIGKQKKKEVNLKQYSAFPESLVRNFGVKSLFW